MFPQSESFVTISSSGRLSAAPSPCESSWLYLVGMSPRSLVCGDLCKSSKSDAHDFGHNINLNFPLHKVNLNNLYWDPRVVRQWIVQIDIDYHREQRYLADFLYQEEIRKSQWYQWCLTIVLSAIQDTILDCQRWQNQAKTGKGKGMQSPASGLPPT